MSYYATATHEAPTSVCERCGRRVLATLMRHLRYVGSATIFNFCSTCIGDVIGPRGVVDAATGHSEACFGN
jgi:hypothetical protein